MTRTAILVIDVQNDFCEGGSLAVAGGAELAAKISKRLQRIDYDVAVTTQDWHIDPDEHFSPEPDYKDTWPVHCVANTSGAALHVDLVMSPWRYSKNFRKGQFEAAYSGFEGVDSEGMYLDSYLSEQEIDTVVVCGLATDYCVKATALNAYRLGFLTYVDLSLCAGVSEDTTKAAIDEMNRVGVILL